MKNLGQKVYLSLLIGALSISPSLWASDESIQGLEHKKEPLKIINGVLQGGLGEPSVATVAVLGAQIKASAPAEVKSKKVGRRKSSSHKKSKQGISAQPNKLKSSTDKSVPLKSVSFASSGAALSQNIYSDLLPEVKREFKAPAHLNLEDFILIACAGENKKESENGKTTKYNKVYLPYQQMTTGFYEVKTNDLAEKTEHLENLKTAIGYEEISRKHAFFKVKEALLVKTASNIKRFTQEFLIGLQSDLRQFEVEVRSLGLNFYAKRVIDEKRDVSTIGLTMRSNFGFYETYLKDLRLPGILVCIAFAVEKDAYKLSR